MWQKVRVLTPKQAYVVGLLCALVIAVPIAFHPAEHVYPDKSVALSAFDILFWPTAADPFVRYFMVTLPLFFLLLGYYNRGVAGALMSAFVGFLADYLLSFLAFCTLVAASEVNVWLGMGLVIVEMVLTFALAFHVHLRWARKVYARQASFVHAPEHYR